MPPTLAFSNSYPFLHQEDQSEQRHFWGDTVAHLFQPAPQNPFRRYWTNDETAQVYPYHGGGGLPVVLGAEGAPSQFVYAEPLYPFLLDSSP